MRNSGDFKIERQGDVHVVNNIGYKLKFKNIRHIPDLRMNLLSIGYLTMMAIHHILHKECGSL